ncbi:hypothetical protein Ga0080574_TMP4337 [Salipiger abyssi]|uniref:Uncharacterized protein n=1 Tax=Salipiger abyssi TaxID=1250539 RepID=A0A1P8UZ60_9RHOB|nr:hypothetical protein Ga0080574_TMP4337 [Salipiger abyssi]
MDRLAGGAAQAPPAEQNTSAAIVEKSARAITASPHRFR